MLSASNWAERTNSAIKGRTQSPTKPYVFITSCVGARGVDINEMRDSPREVTYRTMLKYCDLSDAAAELLYEKRKDVGLTLGGDPYVAYYKSTYRGCPCYYFVHSAIEYIWVKADEWIPEHVHLRFFHDPGHGWLEVPHDHLRRLGIENKITPFSYDHQGMVYLEEDQDAGTYMNALKERGTPIPPIEEIHQEDTPIRFYPPYRRP